MSINLDRVIAVRTKKTIYRDGDRCIKVFQPPYRKSAIFGEASNQVRVQEIGLKVPKVLDITTIDGKWAIVSEYINGKTLEQLIAEHPENKASYYRTLADLQNSIHKNDCPYLYRLKDELNNKINGAELDATTRYELHNQLEHMAKGMAICHGDFCPSNIILSEDGIYYTLDWTLASYGNPLADVAQTYIMLWFNSCYEDAELYLDLYCSEGSVEKEKVYAWLPIIGAAMSVRRPLREREILLECVNSGDFKNHMKKFI
jgi:tRNA A-37 threonylcarbamoyl transferase component Bud32